MSAPPAEQVATCPRGHEREYWMRRTASGQSFCFLCQRENHRRRRPVGFTIAEDLVPNQPIAQAVVRAVDRGEVSWADLARAAGWMRVQRGRRFADTTRVRRSLGLMTTPGRSKYPPSRCRRINYDAALRIVERLGLDPWEVGL